MSSVLALDWGGKRIGFATSDNEGIVVSPRGHIKRKQNQDTWTVNRFDLEAIRKVISEWEIESIVLGLPQLPSGKDSSLSEAARKLGKKLSNELGLPVFFMDEALSSWEQKQQHDVDAAAAATILQSWWHEKQNNNILKKKDSE